MLRSLTLPCIQPVLTLKTIEKLLVLKKTYQLFTLTSSIQLSLKTSSHLHSYRCHHHCFLSSLLVVCLSRPGCFILLVFRIRHSYSHIFPQFCRKKYHFIGTLILEVVSQQTLWTQEQAKYILLNALYFE